MQCFLIGGKGVRGYHHTLTLVLVTLVRIDIETAIRPHAIPQSYDLFPGKVLEGRASSLLVSYNSFQVQLFSLP